MAARRTERRLALLLAGGEGRRLRPLTRRTAKPLVPFAAAHRIIDFALGNLAAAGFRSVHLPGPGDLLDGLVGWRRLWAEDGGTLATLPPPAGRYAGTGDAVRSAFGLFRDIRPDVVAVLPSDHVYGCCLPAVLDAHRTGRSAVTLAVARVPPVDAAQLGVVAVGPSGALAAYREKPDPGDLPPDGEDCLVSTGIFLFDPEVLVERAGARPGEAGDWDLTPALFRAGEVTAVEIAAYWRDAGTIGAYWRAHMDLLDGAFRLAAPHGPWPGPPGADGPVAVAAAPALLGPGAGACPGGVARSVLGGGVRVEEGAVVEESILFPGVRVGRGARLRRVIVEGPNDLPPGLHVDGEAPDPGRRWHCDPCGVAVLPAGAFRSSRTGTSV